MIIYINGDSHAAAAECVNPHAFAEDDEFFYGLGRKPHPDNLRASFGVELANQLYAILDCDAESASSNDRIIRTTREYLTRGARPDLIVIQWSTWEREEWLIDGTYYQITASGIDDVPEEHQDRYKEFVMNVDWNKKTQEAHDKIWQFHEELSDIPHVFFNGNNHFEKIKSRCIWQNSYIDPYSASGTFDFVLKNQGFSTVNPNSWHFGPDAHCFWGNYLLQYCIDHNIVQQ